MNAQDPRPHGHETPNSAPQSDLRHTDAADRPRDAPLSHAQQLRRLSNISREIAANSAPNEVLQILAYQARDVVGTHQAIANLTIGNDAAKDIVAISMSEKYARWHDYNTRPTSSAIDDLVSHTNQPLRLTQAELEALPAWQGIGKEGDRRPPLRGLLLVPLVARSGSNLGLLQLSDKYEGGVYRRG